jgi:hypothetical protein
MKNSEISRRNFLSKASAVGAAGVIAPSFITSGDREIKGSPKGSLEGLFNVKDFQAKGDGITDDTSAIQMALDAAGKTGGRVYLPPTKYLIKGSLKVPPGVSVFGSADMPQYSDPLIGTILLATGGRDDENAPALFEMGASCSVSG